MLLGSVVGEAADVTVDIFSQALTFLCCVGENVTAGTLLEGNEFACETHG